MSIKTWKKEFYPVPADKVPASKALAHSRRKWRGLTKKNLDKHDISISAHNLVDYKSKPFPVDSRTCALCHHFFDVLDSSPCAQCPIFKTHGHDCGEAYRRFAFCHDPLPMIKLLKETK